ETVEEGLIVAGIVNVGVFWSVQETFRTDSIDRHEISTLRATKAEADAPAIGAERSEIGADIPKDFPGTKPGTSRNLSDQAGLVAKFHVRCSRGHLHALDRADGKLSRVHLALLVADGLSVDEEAGLSVIA